MAELIKIENGMAILDKEVSDKLAEYERQKKLINEQEDILKEAIRAEMEAKGILKIDDEEMQISYVAQSYRETFDSKKFKEENSDMYDEYIKLVPAKSSIRIKLN